MCEWAGTNEASAVFNPSPLPSPFVFLYLLLSADKEDGEWGVCGLVCGVNGTGDSGICRGHVAGLQAHNNNSLALHCFLSQT